MQQWYGLSDLGAEDALYDMHSMRDFTGLELGWDAILNDDPELPPSSGRAVFTDAWRHDHGHHPDCGIAVNQEQGAKA